MLRSAVIGIAMIEETVLEQETSKPKFNKRKCLLSLVLLIFIIVIAVHLYEELAHEDELVESTPSLQKTKVLAVTSMPVFFPNATIQQLKLTGLFVSKAKRWAIFSNELGSNEKLQVGDALSVAKFRLEKIQPTQVVLLNPQNKVERTVEI